MYDLSIIVPIYNVGKYLNQAIDSIINLDKEKCEIILVDDGSTDGSFEICESYAERENIKVIHKVNGGLPSARKAGFEVSTGKYIGFLDGDDWVGKDYFTNMLEIVSSFSVDVVCSNLMYSYENKKIEPLITIEDGLYSGSELDELRKKMLYTKPYYTFGVLPCLCTKIIRREWVASYLMEIPNNITLAEDAMCSYPILYNAESVYILNSNKEYFYRQFEFSMTKVHDDKKIEKVLTALNYFHAVMNDKYNVYKLQMDTYYTFLIKDIISSEIKFGRSIRNIRKKLLYFRKQKIVDRTMDSMTEITFPYNFLFWLFKYKLISILIVAMKVYKKLEKDE